MRDLKVPDDMAIVRYDDIPMAAMAKVAAVLELVSGERVMSHQQVREYTLETAKRIKAVDEAADDAEDLPEGTREFKTLFLEADGSWLSKQGKKRSRKGRRSKGSTRSRFEVYVVVAHEGW